MVGIAPCRAVPCCPIRHGTTQILRQVRSIGSSSDTRKGAVECRQSFGLASTWPELRGTACHRILRRDGGPFPVSDATQKLTRHIFHENVFQRQRRKHDADLSDVWPPWPRRRRHVSCIASSDAGGFDGTACGRTRDVLFVLVEASPSPSCQRVLTLTRAVSCEDYVAYVCATTLQFCKNDLGRPALLEGICCPLTSDRCKRT